MGFLDVYDDGKLFWVAREYYWDSIAQMRQKTDAEYGDDLIKFLGPAHNAKVIVDPAAASFKAEMLKRGIWHVDADNDVNDGIRVTSMVLNQKLVRFCRETTEKTIQEKQTYAWDARTAQRGKKAAENPRSRTGCNPLFRENGSSSLATRLILDRSVLHQMKRLSSSCVKAFAYDGTFTFGQYRKLRNVALPEPQA